MTEYTRATNQSIAWFRARNEDGTLDKRPPFQRLSVWSRRQQSALIETILMDYPIPEVYIQEGLTDDYQERYVVVDGQQRISTVLSFVEGELRLDNSTGSEWQGKVFSELLAGERQKILQYQFVIRALPSDWSEDRLRDVFSRLNRGVSALNDQELRHASYWGPFIKCMEDIAADDRWDRLKVFSSTEVRRMNDVEYISELATALLHGPQNKKDDLEETYVLYEVDFEGEPDVRAKFDASLAVLVDVFSGLSSNRWRKKSDFYTLFLIVANDLARWSSSAGRTVLSNNLDDFAGLVDGALSRLGQNIEAARQGEEPARGVLADADAEVANYALAVRGGASDLSARRQREHSLLAWLDAV